ncbi:MAG: DNA-3-methyladenine glycosylase I [Desulfatibacillaceae bacterium]
MTNRCSWPGDDPVYIQYHDTEWGVPVHDDRALFESLVLDGAQAGLSWITILKKRDNYRKSFDGFDIPTVARYTEKDVARLLANPGIVRNRAKIESATRNARATLKIQEEFGSLDAFLWRFVDGQTIKNAWRTWEETPTSTPESQAMSRALKAYGMSFVGPTICYAFMQAVGMVNDHVVGCFRYHEV